jgi:membrane associated rhomboid family serine protease
MSFLENIKSSFKSSAVLTQLIIINAFVFLVLNLTYHLSKKTIDFSDYLSVYSNPWEFLIHFWGLITFMFAHLELPHIFYNMIWLFFMGQLFNTIIGSHRLLFIYIFGGISGALLFFVVSLFVPIGTDLIGASASVMAIVVALGFYAPNALVNVFLFGEIKLKWVVTVAFVLFSLIDFSINTGGKISHVGGAIFGMIYGMQLKNRVDIGAWFERLFKRKSKLKVVYKARMTDEDYNYNRNVQEKTLDELLDKINKSGYDSLSQKDKETLNRLSKNR